MTDVTDLEQAKHGISMSRKSSIKGDESTDTAIDTSVDISATRDDPIDPNIVDFDGPDDPAHPRNWSKARKTINIALLSFSVLFTNISTTMFAPGASSLAADFGVTNSIVLTLTVTIPSLGSSLGPLFLAPMSEVVGRVPTYWVSSILFLGCTVGCSRSTDVAMFLVFRFIGGGCAATFLACGGGTIADLLPQEERGAATALFTCGPLLGPVMGPIVGGFVTEALGWRWTFYLVLMVTGVVTIAAMALMRETNTAVILARKTARLRKSTGNLKLRQAGSQQPSLRQLFERALIRPLGMLVQYPVVPLFGTYTALVFGMTYLLFATFPSVFQQTYGWSVSVSGLSYLGIGIGCGLGLLLVALLSDKQLRDDQGPERRLLLMIWVGPCVPIGIFWYGWAANAGVQWIVPILGTAFIGLGAMVVTSCSQLYMMDTFGAQRAASALAAFTLIRNASGAFLALAADPLYSKLGLGWGNSVLGFIVLAFLPLPVVLYNYGVRLRERFW